MKNLVLAAMGASLAAAPIAAQDADQSEADILGAELPTILEPVVTLDQPASPVTSQPIMVLRDTPVHLMVKKEVTTKTHQAGHRFPLRVDEAIIIDGQTIIPVGATAWGEIMTAESSGNLGKSGKLSARLLYVEAGDRRIAITGDRAASGKSGTAETVMGVLSLGVFGLFAKGNNAKLKAGEMFTAFTSEDTAIEILP